MTESLFPDDDFRWVLRRLFRLGSLVEPHEHAGVRLSLSEMMALGELADVEGMSQHDLGRVLGLEKSTISRLAAGLEDRGWVDRHRDPDNRRLYQLELTSTGREVADLIGKDLRARHESLLNALTPHERESLTIGLKGLARVVEAHHHR